MALSFMLAALVGRVKISALERVRKNMQAWRHERTDLPRQPGAAESAKNVGHSRTLRLPKGGLYVYYAGNIQVRLPQGESAVQFLKILWQSLRKISLELGCFVLVLPGLRIDERRPETIVGDIMLAFALLGAILAVISWDLYENFGLIWPGGMALGFMLAFGSALFCIKRQ